jgi:branched-chain amino acid transport system permease protein
MTVESLERSETIATAQRHRFPVRAVLLMIAAAIVGAVGLLVPSFAPPSSMILLLDAALLGLFGLSVAWLSSRTGHLSLGHAAFYGIGAYVVAIATTQWGWTLGQALAAAVGASVAAGVIVGCVAVRISGLGFAMVTLAFGQALYLLSLQEFTRGWTGGESGLLVTNSESFLWISASELNAAGLWSVAWISILMIGTGLALLNRSRFGTLLSAIKDNEERARFSGFGTFVPQLVAFTISAGVAGVAGALFAISAGFVSPSSLFWLTCAFAIIAAIIGGIHTIIGPFAGALIYQLLVDQLARTGNAELYIGLVFIAVVVIAPFGVAGSLQVLVRRALLTKDRG